MNTAAGETPLDEALALSTAMLESARAQDWIAVANLEVARSALLRQALEAADRPPAEVLAVVLPKILECDRELLALGEAARTDVSAKLLEFRQGRRAHAAYSDSGQD